MIRIDDIELIDKFINEELSPLDKQAFQKRVKDDLEFSKAVRQHIEAVRTIKSYSSSRFMHSLVARQSDWKSGGYKSYSPSIDGTKILLRILIPALILGISYGIFKFVTPDTPPPTPSVPAETDTTNKEESHSTLPADTVKMKPDSSLQDSTNAMIDTVPQP